MDKASEMAILNFSKFSRTLKEWNGWSLGHQRTCRCQMVGAMSASYTTCCVKGVLGIAHSQAKFDILSTDLLHSFQYLQYVCIIN